MVSLLASSGALQSSVPTPSSRVALHRSGCLAPLQLEGTSVLKLVWWLGFSGWGEVAMVPQPGR